MCQRAWVLCCRCWWSFVGGLCEDVVTLCRNIETFSCEMEKVLYTDELSQLN